MSVVDHSKFPSLSEAIHSILDGMTQFPYENSSSIIKIILEQGTLNDLKQVSNYYGRSLMIETIRQLPSLLPRGIAVAKKLFAIPNHNFTCLH